MDILLNMESANNLVALRRLHDRVEANTRALQSLGVAPESYGTLLSSVIVKKLPPEIRILISRKVTDEWDLNTIIQVVGEELGARERALPLKEAEGGGESHPPSDTLVLRNPQSPGYLPGKHLLKGIPVSIVNSHTLRLIVRQLSRWMSERR